MQNVATRGIIVSRQRYSETSWIVRWLSPEAGRVSTIAKGALRPKSPFAGKLDLYYLCEFSYVKSRTGHLHTLRDVSLLEPHLGLRREWTSLLALEYFFDLVTALTEEDTPLEADFDLFLKAVAYLEQKQVTLELVERFERRLYRLHGLGEPPQGADLAQWARQHHFKAPPQRIRLLQEIERLASRTV
jgi:DNA repair protein RecO (recombination protein O)